jgi:hypothetical protein
MFKITKCMYHTTAAAEAHSPSVNINTNRKNNIVETWNQNNWKYEEQEKGVRESKRGCC